MEKHEEKHSALATPRRLPVSAKNSFATGRLVATSRRPIVSFVGSEHTGISIRTQVEQIQAIKRLMDEGYALAHASRLARTIQR